MNEIIYQKSYREYKEELDGVLQSTAEGFVKIGYLLKVARDTNVLAESGYKTVAEFAEAEYNLNKTQVSRFISINDKFSEGGYSDHLMPDYQGFGYAKLTIMLQLPDAVNEELTPEFSKTDIQEIKDEIDEENKISDIEVYIESQDIRENTEVEERCRTLYAAIEQLGEDEPELYVRISDCREEPLEKMLPQLMAPNGDKLYSVRVRGTGRLMITISESSDVVKLINARSGEKECFTWNDMAAAWISAGVLGLATEKQTGEECWQQKYGRNFPVAPVQQEKNEQKKEQRKEPKVKKAPKEWKSVYQPGQQVKVIANDHIGELVKKTDTPGKWLVKFATYQSELSEQQFGEYVEEQEQLHDILPDIPKVETEQDEMEAKGNATAIDIAFEDHGKEEAEEILPGQMEVTDYKGIMPEPIGMNNQVEKEGCDKRNQETTESFDVESVSEAAESNKSDMAAEDSIMAAAGNKEEYIPGKDAYVDNLLKRTETLTEHILAKDWKMARMDLDMMKEDIERAMQFKS